MLTLLHATNTPGMEHLCCVQCCRFAIVDELMLVPSLGRVSPVTGTGGGVQSLPRDEQPAPVSDVETHNE